MTKQSKFALFFVTLFSLALFSKHLLAESVTGTLSQKESSTTKHLGLLVTIKAKQGKQQQVAELLTNAVKLSRLENKTLTWYAIQIDESTFGIFDTFHSEEGREIHLHGEIAKQLIGKAPELFDGGLQVQKINILASKK